MIKYFLFTAVLLVAFTDGALALPEIARYGHFTCTTCHVSPGGGGMLTPYGRDFSAEKLSSWFIDGEQKAIEGLIPINDHYLVGGDARWVQYQAKTGDDSLNKFWRMQTDLEAGIHYGPAWLTGMMGTKPAGPMDDPKEHANLVHRSYMARVDLLDDHLIVRAGLFEPKYGLMLSDHTAFVRTATGLGPDTEQTQAEVIYQDDMFETTFAILIQDDTYDRASKSNSGFNLGLSTFIWDKNRVNVNAISTKHTVETTTTLMTSVGVSGVISVTDRIYGMIEIDRVSNATKSDSIAQSAEALLNYYSLNMEVCRGVFPYIRYEYMDTDLNTLDTSTMRWGAGLMWYPRPHLQFEARSLRSIVNANRSTTDESDVIIHYYF